MASPPQGYVASQVSIGQGGVRTDPNGKLGIFDVGDGSQLLQIYAGAYAGIPTNPTGVIRRTGNLVIDSPNSGGIFIGFNQTNLLQMKNAAGPFIDLTRLPIGATAPLPLAVILAMDNRSG